MDRSHKTLQMKMINSRTDEVGTDGEIMVTIFLNARVNQYLVTKIKPVFRARIIERMLFSPNQFGVSLEILVDK